MDNPDRVACWVSAGDDIVLALYGGDDEKPKDSIASMKEVMEHFSDNLNKMLNPELKGNPTGPLATFSGSISVRGGHKLSEMIDNAALLEIAAKEMWKEGHSDSQREMISPEKIEKKKFEIHHMLGPWGRWTKKFLREIAKEHQLDVKDEGDLGKLNEICSRAEFVDVNGKNRILIPERKANIESCPDYEQLVLPVDEGIYNLVLVQTIAEEELSDG